MLREMGYEFEVMPADIDEKAIRHENPRELVLMLANAKADALLPKIKEPAILITADQVVAWNGQIREKPENEEEAKEFLRTYYQAPAEVINGIVVVNTGTGKRASAVDSSRVYFKEIPTDALEQFAKLEHIYRRAGGFAIRDPLLQPYIEKVEGTDDSVMGLPKELTKQLIREVIA
ncbi:MAG: hypothetical protein UY53_C0001G0054 [Parcubacteria group bacterium GW2011_GWA2_50_10]|nr:MAG: hypothetical protein UY25_C0003G0030 [Candidatus Yanofskybacteria bacterium GW2011_GWC1_48_11]KKW08409.1 MAG: hypothetical protein UY45_C0007G0032 [Parcubacteria group bacterium GW2011_GWA1_49_26]KKW14338.1 MAG: hypothetical protein UY53_C0001G0054 [Parcubacteria group bacterium GW2011_GWA2_50_10]